ncbi:MAG: transglutaminase domain-containing protein [Bacteroidota bacterium]|nr:transglutaminase domain-containing protein [Bacteroidota bacterium]
MKHFIPLSLSLAVFVIIQVSVAQQERGMTSAPLTTEALICTGQAESLETGMPAHDADAVLAPSAMMQGQVAGRDDWRIRDSLVIDTWIPPLGHAGVRFNSSTRMLEQVRSLPSLRSSAQRAVAKSPTWLRAKLEYTLSQLSGFPQENLAAVINDAPDPYVDEVCFAIAHSNPAFLQSQYCYAQLFRDNAELIYAHDKVLPYVEVVDYGTAADEDFYSTVRYWRVDADSNRVQVEVPRDIYYWYIVHPKITDELSSYVDPDMKGHTQAIKPPPQGIFWRDYIFTVTEPIPDTTGVDFPVLRDLVSSCEVLWAERGDEPQAVRQITKWIRDVLDFDSGSERPHQPVRIYKLHMGRCGEHEDLTAAAARACLIPTRGISAYSADHVWNEFWDEGWWQWEPVNNHHKRQLVYTENWGWNFGSVMARRSDGKFMPVTDRYQNKTCTLEIHAKDADDKPVDGAVVMLARRVDQNILIDTYGCTDQDGVARFIVGANNDYYARFDSPHGGSSPAQSNQVSGLMTDSEAGRDYSYSLRSNVSKRRYMQEGNIPGMEDAVDDFAIEHHIDGGGQVVRWQQRFDDINVVDPCVFFSGEQGGTLCHGYVDQDNFQKVDLQQHFAMKWGVADQELGVPVAGQVDGLDFTGDLYYLFVNNTSAHNPAHIRTRFYLRASSLVDVDVLPETHDFALLECAPHPVTTQGAALTLFTPAVARGSARIELFDMLGRRRHSTDAALHGGAQTLRWTPPALPQGHYLLRITASGGATAQRILLLK